MSTRLMIIGGSDAGISAGLRAKELNSLCEGYAPGALACVLNDVFLTSC